MTHYYIDNHDGIIWNWAYKEDVDEGLVNIPWTDIIDYEPIQYKGKKVSLQEILFKSLIYTSITDTYVYLKAEDGTLIKTLRATFLLIVAKAKLNLKLVEDALYDADNQFDPKKTLEENIAKIKGIFDAIDKIFND